jgi:predicted small secreted protein
MKAIIVVMIAVGLSACNTVSGTLQGAGKDIMGVGKWVEPKQSMQWYPQDNRTPPTQEKRQ